MMLLQFIAAFFFVPRTRSVALERMGYLPRIAPRCGAAQYVNPGTARKRGMID
jgi:hypothetical protein